LVSETLGTSEQASDLCPSDREGIGNATVGPSQDRDRASTAPKSRLKTPARSSRNFHRKYHAPFIHFEKILYFARGDAYANMLAPPVSMASISAWVQGRRPKREGSSARSKNSPAWGLTGPREAPAVPPMVLLKEERPSGPCC
jgi:hypothetical protein